MKFGNPKLLESVIREEFEREKSNYDELAGLCKQNIKQFTFSIHPN